MAVIKSQFKINNGTDWDTYHFETDSAQTKHKKSDGTETTVEEVLNSTLGNKADKSHTHDDRYYTENEMNTKLKAKSDTSHTHNAIKTKSGSNSLQFDWVLEGGTWKLKLYVDGTFVKTF